MGKIVWLASYPKSGNTWLRMFLHNYIFEPAAPHDINALTDLSVSESAIGFYQKYYAAAASQLSTRDVQMLRPKVHADLTKLHPDLVFIKTHNAALKFHDIALCTEAMTAGAIYIVRDPRDVALSYARYTGRSVDEIIDFMGNKNAANRGTDVQVFEFLNSWSNHVASWAAKPNILTLRYEDMLNKPTQSFSALVRYLGDQPALARLEKAISFSRFEIAAAQEKSHGYQANAPQAASAFFRNGKAGSWRDDLTAEQRARIETDHGAIMRKLGYEI